MEGIDVVVGLVYLVGQVLYRFVVVGGQVL